MNTTKTQVVWQGNIVSLDNVLFQQIYEKWWANVYALAYSHLKDEEMCRDLVQDVFLELWNRNPGLAPIRSIEAYLVKSTKTALLKSAKKLYADRQNIDVDDASNLCSDEGFESRLSSDEMAFVMNKFVENFPEPRRTIFLMSVEEERTNIEIADNLALSEKTISFHLVKARKELKKLLAKFF